MGKGDTLLNAAIGAAVGLILSFLPAAIVLGGAVAGYLQGAPREYGIGARVGALAGLLALLPAILLVIGLASVMSVGMGMMGMLDLAAGGLFSLVGVVFLLLAAAYFVGGGALGGVIGAYLVDEL